MSELEQRGAAEGMIIVTMTGRRYLLLGKAVTHAKIGAELWVWTQSPPALIGEIFESLAAERFLFCFFPFALYVFSPEVRDL